MRDIVLIDSNITETTCLVKTDFAGFCFQVLLDDHIVKTLTMKGSPFVVPFEAELREWETKLVSSLF